MISINLLLVNAANLEVQIQQWLNHFFKILRIMLRFELSEAIFSAFR